MIVFRSLRLASGSVSASELFRDFRSLLSQALVLGDNERKPSITGIKCPELDLSKASADGTLSCDLTGDLARRVKLDLFLVAARCYLVGVEHGMVAGAGNGDLPKREFRTSEGSG
jgi:hypothetical protein